MFPFTGLGRLPDGTSATEDNFGFVFGVNHLGHFLLTNLLLDLLRKSAPSRVVTVSSGAHRRVKEHLNFTREDPAVAGYLYPHLESYPVSKLANVLFARELARREAASGVISTSLHPGVILSSIWKSASTAHSPLMTAVYHALEPLLW